LYPQFYHLLIFQESGDVYATGSNKFGQLGFGNKLSSLLPQLIKCLERDVIVEISCGHHSAAINDKGDLYLWGTGTFGEYLTPFNVFSI